VSGASSPNLMNALGASWAVSEEREERTVGPVQRRGGTMTARARRPARRTAPQNHGKSGRLLDGGNARRSCTEVTGRNQVRRELRGAEGAAISRGGWRAKLLTGAGAAFLTPDLDEARQDRDRDLLGRLRADRKPNRALD